MVSNMKCLICGKDLKTTWEDETIPPQIASWNGAGVHIFVPGYGSQFDMTEFLLGICDTCIQEKLDQGLLLEIDNE